MRLPRVRMNVKQLMITIAALAIVLGCSIEGIRLKRRRDAFLQTAAEHGLFEYVSREDQKSALEMAEHADQGRARLEKLGQEDPTRAPSIAGMSKPRNARPRQAKCRPRQAKDGNGRGSTPARVAGEIAPQVPECRSRQAIDGSGSAPG